jgi:uroporphyrin-III C-methyltransferase/precorrin-2 dehydrogenase/sirohydrochlorin ferrochelatase
VLSQADVILHDNLVSDEVLDLARRDADRIDVGKRAGSDHPAQEDIHLLMSQAASRGLNVVRLKGGDSFIFGRGGEEIEYLRSHGIGYEIVPGITAAIGCAAYAGIPLTHREHAQVLSFVTGHVAGSGKVQSGNSSPAIEWSGIAGPGKTVVVYMGVQQAGAIRAALLKSGVSAELPAALVVSGTLARQNVIHGRVDTLPNMAAQAGRGAPGLLIIGQVAALGSNLGWFTGEAELKTAA